MKLIPRLFNVFATPGDVFEDVKRGPASPANWLVPALLIIFASWVGAWLIFSQPAIQQQIQEISTKAIEKQAAKQRMSAQQTEQMRQAAEKYGGIGIQVSAYAGSVAVAFGVPFLWGLILWAVGKNALKAGFSYMKAVEAAGLAAMISLLDAIVRTLLILATGNLFAAPSLALLVKDFDPQNTVHSLLALTNVLMFWLLAVRAVALARLAGVSFGKAAVWVFGIWAAYTGALMGFGLAMRAIFGG